MLCTGSTDTYLPHSNPSLTRTLTRAFQRLLRCKRWATYCTTSTPNTASKRLTVTVGRQWKHLRSFSSANSRAWRTSAARPSVDHTFSRADVRSDLAPKFYPVLSSLQRFGEVLPDFGPA